MRNLSFVPLPLNEESPIGLIRRAALINGYPGIRCLLSTESISTTDAKPYSQQSNIAKFLIEEAGRHGRLVAKGFYEPAKRYRYYRIGQLKVENQFFRQKEVAFCDQCSNQSKHYIIADLKFSERCPYHNRIYLFQCPYCAYAFDWRDPGDGLCANCHRTLTCSTCTDKECSAENTLLEFFRNCDQKGYDRFILLCRQLGYSKAKSTLPQSEHSGIFNAAAGILTGDTPSVSEYLISLRRRFPNVDPCWIVARLASIENPTTRSAIEIFQEYLTTSHRPTICTSHRNPLPLTSAQIKKTLKISDKQFLLFLKKAKFYTFHERSHLTSNEATRLREIALEFRATKQWTLPCIPSYLSSRSHAQKKLNISPKALTELLNDGALDFYGTITNPYFDPESIRTFDLHYESFNRMHQKTGTPLHLLLKYQRKLQIEPAFKITQHRGNWILSKRDANKIYILIENKDISQGVFSHLPIARTESYPSEHFIDVREAELELKLPRGSINNKLNRSIFHDVHRSPKNRILIPKKNIEKFKSRNCKLLRSLLKPVVRAQHTANLVSFLSSLQVNIISISSPSGLSLWISKSDNDKVTRLLKQPSSGRKDTIYTTWTASKELKQTAKEIKLLTESGLIASITTDAPLLFSARAIDEYEQNYISTREIQRIHGFSCSLTKNLIKALSYLGLNPLIPPFKKPNFAIYSRADYMSAGPTTIQLFTTLKRLGRRTKQ